MPDKTKSFKKGHKSRKPRKQFYKMKGCSKIKTQKHLGGANFAYPSNNIHIIQNPHLAYTGSLKNAYPNPGITNQDFKGWINTQIQRGGNCGCNLQTGGNNGLPFGQNLPDMKGIPYPNGTAGSPLVGGDISTWPGVNNVGGSGNYYKINTYDNGFTTNIKNEGAQKPFLGGAKRRNTKKSKTNRKTRGGSGFNFSNSIAQDFVNVGRQFSSGLGNTYNTFNGYQQAASPLPWKGQLYNTPSASSLKLLKM
jgi:hypothetical protein